jgi:hypothetical protein
MQYGSPSARSVPRAMTAWRVALALSIACFGFVQRGNAEVRISGTADALRMEAREATLEEALRALQASFNFQYGGAGALDGIVNGTYSGSLSRVVARLLAGRDYVMRGSADGFAVEIFGPDGPAKNRAVDAKPSIARTIPEAPKNCIYKDGDRVIPVEC